MAMLMEEAARPHFPGTKSKRSPSLDEEVQFIEQLVAQGGPRPQEYPALRDWFERVRRRAATGEITNAGLHDLRTAFGGAMSTATNQGFVCARPHGYPGDFEIIDKIYVRHISPDPRFMRWDAFFHAQSATKAVRNRKSYFHSLVDLHSRPKPPRILKLASGPGRSMFEWLSLHPNAEVTFDCIELDPNAIRYSEALNEEFLSRISFKQQNVVRFQPSRHYDLIWIAGLFDYFPDRIFASVLKRLIPAIGEGGELVIGNFSPTNPSRAYMEFGGWSLHHRTADELVSLALRSGAAPDTIQIDAEPLGINLFLRIKSQVTASGSDGSTRTLPLAPRKLAEHFDD
jgi:extracellular factor (EF) 3-hydroxypalmitic acid methyl ester biosynthesis protein